MLSLLFCASLAATPQALKAERGSGRLWHSLYEWGRDGTGPPNSCLQISWPADGSAGYQVSIYEDEDSPARQLICTLRREEAIRFRKLEVVENPCNDIWEENGQTYKQFPKLLFVAHGVESGRPVSLVWGLGDERYRRPELLLKVFSGDARRLGMPSHGSKEVGSFLVERARASWLPMKQWPARCNASSSIVRTWTYHSTRGFSSSRWRLRL